MIVYEEDWQELLEKIAPDQFADITDLEQAARQALALVGPPGAAVEHVADILERGGYRRHSNKLSGYGSVLSRRLMGLGSQGANPRSRKDVTVVLEQPPDPRVSPFWLRLRDWPAGYPAEALGDPAATITH